MGYETRMYCGTLSNFAEDKGMVYMSIVGMVDLCKCGCNGALPDIIKSSHKKDVNSSTGPVYFFAFGSNKRVKEDSYGDRMYPVPAKTVLKAMRKSHEEEKYRRYAITIPMLREFIKAFKDDAVVVFYGY